MPLGSSSAAPVIRPGPGWRRPRRMLRWTSILGSRQITDAYLLALAVRKRGRFVTFDRAAPLDAVEGATAGHLVAL